MPSTERSQKRALRDIAEEAWGGDWSVTQWDEEKIELHNKVPKTNTMQREVIWDECINLCRLRLALKTSAERIRDNVDRRVRWDCVEAVWFWLTTTVATFSALIQQSLPVAWCSLLAAFTLMCDALSAGSEWVQPDPQRAGELWIRVGLDGVPLWKAHVVACTMAPCAHLRSLPMQSPHRHFVFCLLRGTESKEVVAEMLRHCKVVEDVQKLDGSTVFIQGKQYTVRVFLCGDHMLMYKIAGCDPPSCTRPERRPCPCCDATPDDVASYIIPCPAMAASGTAMFPTIPIDQYAIDCSHGIVNVLFTVQIPLVAKILEDAGLPKAAVDRFIAGIDVDIVALTSGDDDGAALPRSISNALKFYEKRLYTPIVDMMRQHCKTVTRIDNRDVETADLVMSMFTLTHRMLRVAYKPKPSAEDISGACDAATSLRKVLHALDAPCTPWMHVWTCHVPQFLRRWGTLEPFLCHGFEGRWRDLKAEIKLSTHGQWKGAKCGFETVIQYSIATWSLLKLQVPLVGRSFHVPKTYGSAMWDEFVKYVRQQTKDRNASE